MKKKVGWRSCKSNLDLFGLKVSGGWAAGIGLWKRNTVVLGCIPQLSPGTRAGERLSSMSGDAFLGGLPRMQIGVPSERRLEATPPGNHTWGVNKPLVTNAGALPIPGMRAGPQLSSRLWLFGPHGAGVKVLTRLGTRVGAFLGIGVRAVVYMCPTRPVWHCLLACIVPQ